MSKLNKTKENSNGGINSPLKTEEVQTFSTTSSSSRRSSSSNGRATASGSNGIGSSCSGSGICGGGAQSNNDDDAIGTHIMGIAHTTVSATTTLTNNNSSTYSSCNAPVENVINMQTIVKSCCDVSEIVSARSQTIETGAPVSSRMMMMTPTTTTATPIGDFYRNATILITGGTGFVGKVLIEKLLRSFALRKIYMLIRCKDNMGVEERLTQFFNESIFNTMRKDSPELFAKVHPIHANYGAVDLDIAVPDRAALCAEVEVVFNVVASVKFNEKLSDAIDINVLGTKKIIDLAMEMKNLKSFVHISTLYCNCNRRYIKEQVYENEIGYEKIMQIYRIFDDETLEKMRHCLIGDMPNTYTMTKKCAENLVNHRAFDMPAGIFRPPIVMSTYKQPVPGWTDNLYGPSGLCTWSARGLVRCIWGTAQCKANMAPADYCVNAMIATAWDIARRYKMRRQAAAKEYKTELPVYNYVSDKNSITWGQYMKLSRQGYHEPFDKALWCFSYVIIPSKPLHRTIAFFLHNVPAYILDLIAMATGQKRIYVKAYRKIARIIEMMSWFGLKEWSFAHANIDELDALLVADERPLLQFSMATINWREYFQTYLSGIRRYFFKENVSNDKLRQRKAIYRRMRFVHTLLKSTLGLSLIMCIVRIYLKFFRIIPKLRL